MSEELSKAKDVLLRTLEQLEKAEEDLGGPVERVDLVVVYSIGREDEDGWHDVGGWVSTPGPKHTHVALMQRAADAQEESMYARDDQPEDEDE